MHSQETSPEISRIIRIESRSEMTFSVEPKAALKKRISNDSPVAAIIDESADLAVLQHHPAKRSKRQPEESGDAPEPCDKPDSAIDLAAAAPPPAPGPPRKYEPPPEPCPPDAAAILPAQVKPDARVGPAPVDCVFEEWSDWGPCQYSCGPTNTMRSRKIKTVAEGGGKECSDILSDTKGCENIPCPEDCHWNQWGQWSHCSASCGRGTRFATRTSVEGKNGGACCTGEPNKTTDCFFEACNVNCKYTDWGEWFPCSASCGHGKDKGKRSRYRQVEIPKSESGADCEGEPVESENCAQTECPIDCQLTEWTQWTACTATCGIGGISRRTRSVTAEATAGGADCGLLEENKTCDTAQKCCPVDCTWSAWREWQPCTVTCGCGTRSRHRTQAQESACGGQECCGNAKEEDSCQGGQCPQDCKASQWAEWTPCSVTCGNDGRSERTRVIESEALLGGRSCHGGNTSFQQRACEAPECPVDCEWADWQDWRSCSTSCGNGTSLRIRVLSTPELNGGKSCVGSNLQNRDCLDKPCPTHCAWKPWSEWSTCSVTCGSGTSSRTRVKKQSEANGGDVCEGSNVEEVPCSEDLCPIDCEWGLWSHWECSSSCGNGTSRRNRTLITEPQNGGKKCEGPDTQATHCVNLPECPVDCKWSAWGGWSVCSSTCGTGVMKRNRHRLAYESNGGHTCYGTQDDEAPCTMDNCPEDCVWGDWGPWTSCPVSCGNATRERYRGVRVHAKKGGAACQGSPQDNKTCTEDACPVDCVWNEWTNWTKCSKSCGGGVTTRTRRELVLPLNGGQPCIGSVKQDDSCKEQHCPLDCKWGQWSEWDDCDQSCGSGLRKQTRQKTSAQFGGVECEGNDTRTESCNEQVCPVDCDWAEWTPWANCTKSCDAGVTTRSRPRSTMEQFGGAPCLGRSFESAACNTEGCARDCLWSGWGQWTTCSRSCNGGTARRFRDVLVTPKNGGKACTGEDTEDGDCNTRGCPVSCVWNEWSVWSNCDKTCNGGARSRSRDKKVADKFGGTPCPGDSEEKEHCGQQACPIDCKFGQWSDWGECSVTCGKGLRFRTRTRMEARFGGSQCVGDLIQNGECVNCEDQPGCPKTQPKSPLSDSGAPCSKEDLEAGIKTLTWTRHGKALAAKIKGDTMVFAEKVDQLAVHCDTVAGIQKAIADFGSLPNPQDIDVELSMQSAGKVDPKVGNLKITFTVYLYKDGKRVPASVLKDLANHDAKEVSNKMMDSMGKTFSLSVVSMSLSAEMSPS